MTHDPVVQQLVDRVKIMETVHRYCRYADLLDPSGMVESFTEDCVVIFHDDGPRLEGREAFKRRLEERLGRTVSGSHHVSNEELIFEAADRVRAHLYLYSWQRFDGFPSTADVHRWGRYEMDFVNDGAAWRIKYMRLLSAGEYGSPRIGEHFGKQWP